MVRFLRSSDDDVDEAGTRMERCNCDASGPGRGVLAAVLIPQTAFSCLSSCPYLRKEQSWVGSHMSTCVPFLARGLVRPAQRGWATSIVGPPRREGAILIPFLRTQNDIMSTCTDGHVAK